MIIQFNLINCDLIFIDIKN